MTLKKNKIPSVLMLILSTLGILIGISIAALTLISLYVFPAANLNTADEIPILSTSVLSISISILNVPTLISSINTLKGRATYQSLQPQFMRVSYLIVLWMLIIVGGYFITREGNGAIFLAPLTVAAVIIPVWWLIEFSRKGLPRSTKLLEWGTLTTGLTITPIVIIIIEITLVLITSIVVIIALGLRPDLSNQLLSLLGKMSLNRGGIGNIEKILYELMKQPFISTAVILTVGLFAPLVEEIIKPMAIWFLLNRPLEEHEGFSLGLISGGTFSLLESAGMVIQMDIQHWLIAIILRAATGVLHIGLSGLVGYGLARSWNQKQYGRGILYIISAAILHSAWNSLALLSGLSSSAISEGSGVEISDITSVIPLLFLMIVFITIVAITLKINSRLKEALEEGPELSL